jgi:hypothetical protein
MKKITIVVSDETEISTALRDLKSQIPESVRKAAEFSSIYPHISACIEDFSARAKKLAKAGTTIHIEKVFSVSGTTITVKLNYPKKVSFLQKLTGILKKD